MPILPYQSPADRASGKPGWTYTIRASGWLFLFLYAPVAVTVLLMSLDKRLDGYHLEQDALPLLMIAAFVFVIVAAPFGLHREDHVHRLLAPGRWRLWARGSLLVAIAGMVWAMHLSSTARLQDEFPGLPTTFTLTSVHGKWAGNFTVWVIEAQITAGNRGSFAVPVRFHRVPAVQNLPAYYTGYLKFDKSEPYEYWLDTPMGDERLIILNRGTGHLYLCIYGF